MCIRKVVSQQVFFCHRHNIFTSDILKEDNQATIMSLANQNVIASKLLNQIKLPDINLNSFHKKLNKISRLTNKFTRESCYFKSHKPKYIRLQTTKTFIDIIACLIRCQLWYLQFHFFSYSCFHYNNITNIIKLDSLVDRKRSI